MSELGQLLLEARTAKELSLADAEVATRIRQKYLEALEGGNYAVLPRGATARGFLRVYAEYLGLDSGDLLRLYAQESGDSGQALLQSESLARRAVDYRPLEFDLSAEHAPQGGSTVWRWAIAVVILVALGGGGWWTVKNSPPWASRLLALLPVLSQSTTEPTPDTAASVATPTRGVRGPTPTPPPEPTGLVSAEASPVSDVLPLPIPTVQATAAPQPTKAPTTAPQTAGKITVVALVTQVSWVSVSADGNKIEEGLLEPGQTRTWEAKSWLSLRTGNAAGISLKLNDQDLGPMGTSSQVVDRTWVLKDGRPTEGLPTPTAPPSGAPATTAPKP